MNYFLLLTIEWNDSSFMQIKEMCTGVQISKLYWYWGDDSSEIEWMCPHRFLLLFWKSSNILSMPVLSASLVGLIWYVGASSQKSIWVARRKSTITCVLLCK